MRLKLQLPEKALIDAAVSAVTAEAPDGAFTLLPGHIDFVSALVPSILTFRESGEDGANREQFVAIDEGILVKRGRQVSVVVRHAVQSDDLAELEPTVMEDFRQRDQRERKARTALARLESNFIERFARLDMPRDANG